MPLYTEACHSPRLSSLLARVEAHTYNPAFRKLRQRTNEFHASPGYTVRHGFKKCKVFRARDVAQLAEGLISMQQAPNLTLNST